MAIEVRDLARQHLGEVHPGFAVSLNNLGELYREMGNYAAAEPLLRRASDILRRALGEDHPTFATSLNNLALLYHALGNYAAAEPLCQQASDILRRSLGAKHPHFAISLNNLGVGRDVLRFGAVSASDPTEPLLAADPDFDLSDGTTSASLPRTSEPEKATAPQAKNGFWSWLLGHRSTTPPTAAGQATNKPSPPVGMVAHSPLTRRLRALDRSRLHFGRLPGTRLEGERIAGLLGVQPWLGGTALEGRIKAWHSPHILHLATHGFFLEDQKRDPNTAQSDFGMIGWQPGLTRALARTFIWLSDVELWLFRDAMGWGKAPR